MAKLFTPATANKQQAKSWANHLSRQGGGNIGTSFDNRPRITQDFNVEYDSYFKIVDTSEGDEVKIKIIDGLDETNSIVGYFLHNYTETNVESEELVITEEDNGYVYLIIDDDYDYTFSYETERPEQEINGVYIEIGEISFNDTGDGIEDIRQTQYGSIYLDLMMLPGAITNWDETKKQALIHIADAESGNNLYEWFTIEVCT